MGMAAQTSAHTLKSVGTTAIFAASRSVALNRWSGLAAGIAAIMAAMQAGFQLVHRRFFARIANGSRLRACLWARLGAGVAAIVRRMKAVFQFGPSTFFAAGIAAAATRAGRYRGRRFFRRGGCRCVCTREPCRCYQHKRSIHEKSSVGVERWPCTAAGCHAVRHSP